MDEMDVWSAATQIVADSQLKNDKLSVTGALLFTGKYFAHIIEGPKDSVEKLMMSISKDSRHGNIHILEHSFITIRKFHALQLAYSGSSQFVTRHVIRSIRQTTAWERRCSAEWLTELAWQFLAARSH